MNKEDFYNNLIKASDAVYPFTCEMVSNILPPDIKYIVNIYSNFRDGLEESETTFPDIKRLNQTTDPINAKEVIDILWMESAIPEWINITVDNYDDNFTYLVLECCGRFSKLDKHMYHKDEGYPPFHAMSPALPPASRNENDELIGKFDLRWNKK